MDGKQKSKVVIVISLLAGVFVFLVSGYFAIRYAKEGYGILSLEIIVQVVLLISSSWEIFS